MSCAPLAPMACATASAGGKTTAAGWNTEPLCTSSCSATCAAAALASAAIMGEVVALPPMTSLGPAAGPCDSAKRVMLATGRAWQPASTEPNQSTHRSSARRCTGAGTSLHCSVAANWARGLTVAWFSCFILGSRAGRTSAASYVF